ncbi:MAG: hypothetical protein KDK48_06805, partial [Chlamydiia bacterium]|nr:hypothetical protein [Chlamydiia bacterium]
KGSTAHKIAAALKAGGYRVGLFTSPHILEYNERIRINGVKVSEDTLLPKLEKLLALEPEANFFEITTALAFQCFAEAKVDVAVVEAGIGGLFDATNTVHPCLAVITSIGFDHQEMLGDTLEEIARNKFGIIKEGAPALIGPTVPAHPQAVKLSGDYQTFDEENSALAVKALEMLQTRFPLDAEAIQIGLKSHAPCRLQRIGNLIVDVAHNPAGVKRAFDSLRREMPLEGLRVAFRLAPGKDPSNCLAEIPPECLLVEENPTLVMGSFRWIAKFLSENKIKFE